MAHQNIDRIYANASQSERSIRKTEPAETIGTVPTNARQAQPMPVCDSRAAHREWIREDERKRLARDLHDELGQQMSVLKMDIVALREKVVKVQPELSENVEAVLRQFDATMHSFRNVIRGLRPAVLELGLRAALEGQCAEFMRRTSIGCDIQWNVNEIMLTDCCAIALFRTLQESLTNIYRHARASHIRIFVFTGNGSIVMRVIDNGIGFVYERRDKKDAFGLSGIHERVNALGGQLFIESAKHNGTILTVLLPAESQ